MSVKVFLEEVNIWLQVLREESCLHQCRRVSHNLLGVQMEQKVKERLILFLVELEHPSSLLALFLSSWFPGRQTPGLTPAAPLFRLGLGDRPLYSESQAFRRRLKDTTGSPRSPAGRPQIMGLLGLHNCLSQFL